MVYFQGYKQIKSTTVDSGDTSRHYTKAWSFRAAKMRIVAPLNAGPGRAHSATGDTKNQGLWVVSQGSGICSVGWFAFSGLLLMFDCWASLFGIAGGLRSRVLLTVPGRISRQGVSLTELGNVRASIIRIGFGGSSI